MLTLSQKQLSGFVPTAGAFIVTDLDECTINSDHRRSFCPNTGELNIAAWHARNTEEDIENDTLRPWGERFARLVNERADCMFAVCTSREFNAYDFSFMADRLGLDDKNRIWHRPDGCELSREGLKHDLFVKALIQDFDFCLAVNSGCAYFFDDKVKNVLAAEQLGLIGVLVY